MMTEAGRSGFDQLYSVAQHGVRRTAGRPLPRVLVGLLSIVVIIILLLSQEDPEVGTAP
jgi:hypothetical protein